MNLNNLFTLVIPVRDRHFNLQSIIKYYDGRPYRKIIYDASVNPYDGYLGDLEYFHAGPEFQHMSYLNVYKMVKTPYLLNCPDDDIMTQESIDQCVNFLENNPDYSVCDGEVVEWTPNTNSVFPAPKPDVFRARVLCDWDSMDILDRIRFAVVCCSRGCMHSVVRTKDAVDIMQNFINNPCICPLNFLDRVYLFASACRGKIKTLPVVQHVRTSNQRPDADRNMFNPDIAKEEIDGYGLKLDVLMQNKIDQEHCSTFAHYLSEQAEMTDIDAVEWVIELYKDHFALRSRHGGGGYYGPPLPLNTVEMPCSKDESSKIVSEAIACMQMGV
tara:strand:+ start:11723 stop:12709 length:987 start_codon:yes stop_codon:yes gene_type:complete